MYIYLNGNYVLEHEAKISPFDHGFLYGLGVFETFRIYDGHPFLLDDHFQRLQRSVAELNISLNLSKERVSEIVGALLKLNDLKNAYVRFNISAGEAPVGLQTETYSEPTIIVFIKPLQVQLTMAKNAEILQTRRNTPEGLERLKSHHYLNNIIGKRELKVATNEGIFLTNEGFVAEGIVSNIFWFKEGKVFTPSLKTGILNGITRQFVFELLIKENISFNEGFYTVEELLDADEVFITNSIQEIVLIKKIDEWEFKQDELTVKLQLLYQKAVSKRLVSKEQL